MAGSVDAMGDGAGRVASSPAELVLQRAYEEHRDRLVGLFVNRTGDPVLAEDLAHDVMVRLAGAVDRLDPSRPVWPYLRVVAHNLLVDHQRREARQMGCDAAGEVVDEPAQHDPVDDTVVLRSLLDRAIGELPDRQRVAVELRCEREWDVSESADFLGLDPRAFRQLLFRARQNLRQTLDAAGARARGVVLPVYLGVRLGARSLSDRVREFVQPTVPLGEALAGVAVAATIGLSTVVALPAAEAEPRQQVSKAMEFVRQDVTASESSPATTRAQEVAVGARHTATSVSTPADEVAPAQPPPPSGSGATVIEAPNAVPNSKGNVAVDDDQEHFVVSHEIAAKTDVEEFRSTGEAIAIGCDNVVGEALCDER